MSGFLEIRSHEVVQVDGLVDGVRFVFDEELHPRVEPVYVLYCAICAILGPEGGSATLSHISVNGG